MAIDLLSRLQDASEVIVLDTSALINLSATTHCHAILRALGNQFVIERSVQAEFTRKLDNEMDRQRFLEQLKAEGLLSIESMDQLALGRFLNLVSAEIPDALGDGEAATISIATGRASVVLDDSKAKRICAKISPQTVVYGSLDLFASSKVISQLGNEVVVDAIYSALIRSRMRIPHAWKDWIISVLGEKRASSVNSLSSYLSRKVHN